MAAPEIVTGTVKWFNAEKGYGFIATADRGDLFVHMRALGEGRTTLAAGEHVYFNVRETPKGLEAANVRVGTPPPPPKPAQPTVALAAPATAAVKMRVVTRPAAVRQLGRPGQAPSLVAFTVELGVEGAPPLPAGLPARGTSTACLVLISVRQWKDLAAALDADPQDRLIVDGYAGLDPLAPGMILLRATSVTTQALLDARRAAQAERNHAPQAPVEAEAAGDTGEMVQ